MPCEVSKSISAQLIPYVQIMRGLADIFGDGSEILMHDTSRLDSSLVACAGDRLTGRPLGSPMSAYGVELVTSGRLDGRGAYIYMTRTNDGSPIKCCVIPLRGTAGELIGLICVHLDATRASALLMAAEQFFRVTDTDEQVDEFFGAEPEEIFRVTMDELAASRGMPLNKLSKDEKIDVIRELMERGLFSVKGGVQRAARELGNSKFTIYAYMREVREKAHRVERGGSGFKTKITGGISDGANKRAPGA